MPYCRNCGEEVNENAAVCLQCGVAVKPLNSVSVNDDGNIIWGILGFFVPIAGLILYLIWKETAPLNAKMAGKGALVYLIVTVCIGVLYVLFFTLMFGSVIVFD